MNELKNERAHKVFQTLCAVLDKRNWNYAKDDERLIINLEVHGEDLPMKFIMITDVQRQLIRILSLIPVAFKEDKRIEGAIAACVASYGLTDGSFDYDIESGHIFFKQTASFIDGEVGEGLLDYMISCACWTVDEYNDKFVALNNGIISITDFIEKY
jgi:hypothetical protein